MFKRGILLLVGLSLSIPVVAMDYYLSPQGRDEWSGKLSEPNADQSDGPLVSLKRIPELIKNRTKTEKTTFYFRAGTYLMDEPLLLSKAQSGTATAPVSFECWKNEEVRILGGKTVDSFEPVKQEDILKRLPEVVRDQVLEADLKRLGITDYGKMSRRGFGQPVHPAGLELFFRDQPMQLACWPNDGWATIASIPCGTDCGMFCYEGDRPDLWSQATDIWLHGYWGWDWADSYESVATINTASKEIHTQPPHGVYGYHQGRRYRALNLLEEIDQPGEWFLDRETGKVYFLPPEDLQTGDVVVSTATSFVIGSNVNWIVIRGLSFEYCRGSAMTFQGGVGINIHDCRFRNIGNRAIEFNKVQNSSIQGCSISECGDGGIVLDGGDRMTLTPGNLIAQNNHIFKYARWSRTYRPAISIFGVGNLAAHNHIHDSPHNGIMIWGNEHIIEYNHIHHVCRETSDVGAFYMGRDWTARGNIIRYNFFHHLGGFKSEHGFGDAISIYLDDWTSGTTVFGNICYRGGRGVLSGGGRNNTIENNIFVECDPAVHVDSRGLGWAKNYFDGRTNTLIERMEEVRYDQPPYSQRYPELLTLYEDEPALAKYNKVVRNISWKSRWLELQDHLTDKIVEIRDNLVDVDPLFVDVDQLDFRLQENSPAYELGFQKIPFEKIGPEIKLKFD